MLERLEGLNEEELTACLIAERALGARAIIRPDVSVVDAIRIKLGA